jgi:uncharacterized Rmd1/YagE family protein
MEKSVKILAMHVARQIDLKSVRSTLDSDPRTADDFTLFCGSEMRFQLYTRYGVVVFSDHTQAEAESAIQKIRSAVVNLLPSQSAELEIILQTVATPRFETGRLVIDTLDESVILACMNILGQSVALNYFHSISQTILTDVQNFANTMQREGKLRISRKGMLRFMGQSLSIRNEISRNIFIFKDTEYVNEENADLQRILRQQFNVFTRISEIEYANRTIEDNLKIFLQISNQRESNVLEWIIIILIMMEILQIFIPQLING